MRMWGMKTYQPGDHGDLIPILGHFRGNCGESRISSDREQAREFLVYGQPYSAYSKSHSQYSRSSPRRKHDTCDNYVCYCLNPKKWFSDHGWELCIIGSVILSIWAIVNMLT